MKRYLIILMVLAVSLGMLASCEKFLDVNTDPNSPTQAEAKKLLPFIEKELAESMGMDNFLGNGLSVYVHHITMREDPNAYNMNGENVGGVRNSWLYFNAFVLKNLDELILLCTEDGDMQYAGIAKALKAYTYSQMVDIWGDIPFSEAGDLNNLHPRPDNAKDIYNACFALLDEAIADMKNAEALNSHKPGSDDLIYGGNMNKWLAAANSMKLRMLNNTRLVKSQITSWDTQLAALVSLDSFILSGNDFQFMYNRNTTPEQRHPEFISTYEASQKTSYVSPWIYETMKGSTYNFKDNPLAGIQDPRVPYYFFNQLKADGEAEAKTDYRDGGFVSTLFGSTGANVSNNMSASMTVLGMYPCGGKYDDGNGSTSAVTTTDGTGAAPHKMITFADVKFTLAELALAGENVGSAADVLLEAGIRAAFAHVNRVCTTGGNTATAIAADAIDTYLTAVMAKYSAGDDAKKLEIVMTQRWIAGILSPFDLYTGYRRTGYPKLFIPENVSGVAAVTPFDEEGTDVSVSPVRVPTSVSRNYPKSIDYSVEETDRNRNMSQKGDLKDVRLFWDTRTYSYDDKY